MRVLMVCLGNICRSPLAEGILRHQANAAGLNWTIDSAGIYEYHVGSAPHADSQAVAKMHGINISDQRARRLLPEDAERFDLIYALANDVHAGIQHILGDRYNDKQVRLLMNELNPGKNENVPDPYYGTIHDFRRTYELLDSACAAVIRNYQNIS